MHLVNVAPDELCYVPQELDLLASVPRVRREVQGRRLYLRGGRERPLDVDLEPLDKVN